jgi:hypothetical protein
VRREGARCRGRVGGGSDPTRPITQQRRYDPGSSACGFSHSPSWSAMRP